MNRTQFANLMEDVFQNEISALRKSGQQEYAGGDDNAFGNFDRLSKALNLDPMKVLWVYAMKHKDGIESYLRGHESQREPVEGRINDLIVYLFLLRGMIERRKGLPQHSPVKVSGSFETGGMFAQLLNASEARATSVTETPE